LWNEPERNAHPQITLIAQILILEFNIFDYENEDEDEDDAKKTTSPPPGTANIQHPMSRGPAIILYWVLDVGCSMLDVSNPKNNKSLPDLSVRQGQMGDGSAPGSLSHADIRRAPLRGLSASRRHSPRQAEFSAS
jgi:hypothetical protein